MRRAILAMAIAALLAGCGGGTPKRAADPIVGGPASSWAAGARRAPGFHLTDQNGRAFSLASYRGRIVVLTFLDPLCSTFCPIEAARLGELVRSLPPAARPAIVSVSVNIFGNARRYLVEDMSKWRPGPTFRWGIGTPKTLAAVWRKYAIGVLDQKRKVAGVVVHDIVHTEAAYVIDADGYERALFLWPFTAADVKTELAKLGS